MKKRQLISMAMVGTLAMSLAAGVSAGAEEAVAIDQAVLGETNTDLAASLKILTNRTDLVDSTFQDYIAEFNEMYPNIEIEYEGITDYSTDITTRLSTGDWGDICMIPDTVSKEDLSLFFMSFGDSETLSGTYTLLDKYTYDGQVYGIPSMANLSGIVYNTRVFEEAGVTELPTSPDAFLDALQLIADNTDAIPLYTNFAAGWTMNQWDSYISSCATGDANFKNAGFTHGENPFADNGDGTGAYAVFYTLYEAVSRGLTEDDPTTTDWEGSKGMLNNGEIGCMVLGSWAIPQMQSAGDNADDIAYMPFPINVNGVQYTTQGPDYFYGVNVNSDEDTQQAAALYIKYLVENSGYAATQGGIDCLVDAEFPEFLAAFQTDSVKTLVDVAAAAGEESLYDDINNESELGLGVSGECALEVVTEAVSGGLTLDELVDEWNAKWTAAQEVCGVTPEAYTAQAE